MKKGIGQKEDLMKMQLSSVYTSNFKAVTLLLKLV